MAKRTMRYGQVDPEEVESAAPAVPSTVQRGANALQPQEGQEEAIYAPPPQAPPPHAPPSHAQPPGLPWFETPFIVYVLCVVFFPVGLYGLWKNSSFSPNKKWVITGLTLLLWLGLAGSGSGAGSESGGGSGDCSATYTQNGCTYYRDSTCNVIARDCD